MQPGLDHPMHASFFVRSCGRTSSRCRRPTDVAAALERAVRGVAATRSGRSSRRSCARRSSTRARRWSSRPSSSPRADARAAATRSRAPRGRGRPASAGQRLFYPPDVSGWDDTRWLDTNTVARRAGTSSTRRSRATPITGRRPPATRPRPPAQAVANARAFWNDPLLSPETVPRCATLDGRRADRDRTPARPLARAAPERPADADRRCPPTTRSADAPTHAPHEFSAPTCCAAPPPRPAAACRPSRRACPRRPAPGCRAAPSSPAPPASRWPSSAASLLSPRAFEDGIAAAQAAGPSRVLVSVFLAGGMDSLTLLVAGRPRPLRDAAPDAGRSVSGNAADAFTEDPTLQWHPKRRGAARPAPRRARSR